MPNVANTKNVLILRLTDFYKNNPKPSSSELLKAVTEKWRVNLDRANSVEYILAFDDKDDLVGVYKAIKAVDTGIKSGNSTRKIFSIDNITALELLQNFIGQNLKYLFPQGSKNPVRYGEMNIGLI